MKMYIDGNLSYQDTYNYPDACLCYEKLDISPESGYSTFEFFDRLYTSTDLGYMKLGTWIEEFYPILLESNAYSKIFQINGLWYSIDDKYFDNGSEECIKFWERFLGSILNKHVDIEI